MANMPRTFQLYFVQTIICNHFQCHRPLGPSIRKYNEEKWTSLYQISFELNEETQPRWPWPASHRSSQPQVSSSYNWTKKTDFVSNSFVIIWNSVLWDRCSFKRLQANCTTWWQIQSQSWCFFRPRISPTHPFPQTLMLWCKTFVILGEFQGDVCDTLSAIRAQWENDNS